MLLSANSVKCAYNLQITLHYVFNGRNKTICLHIYGYHSNSISFREIHSSETDINISIEMASDFPDTFALLITIRSFANAKTDSEVPFKRSIWVFSLSFETNFDNLTEINSRHTLLSGFPSNLRNFFN